MINSIASWIPVLLFMALFAVAVASEALWLKSRGAAKLGIAGAFAFITDMLGLIVGSIVAGIILTAMFMAVMGPAGRGSSIGEWFYITAGLLCLVLPLAILTVIKRAFLGLLKINQGTPAWRFAAVSAALTITICVVPPPLVFYILTLTFK